MQNQSRGAWPRLVCSSVRKSFLEKILPGSKNDVNSTQTDLTSTTVGAAFLSRKIYQKPISEIMAEYAPVYPNSRLWTDTVNHLLEHDGDIIIELQRQYLEQGQFREPVILKLSESDDETEDTDEAVPGKIGYVGDGTHRLVSAYLLGVESILVSDKYEETEETGYSITTLIVSAEDRQITEDETDILFHKLRSICISDSLWITSSTAGGAPNGVTIYWDEYDKALLQIINNAVDSKLKEIFPEASFTVETYCETWEF